MYTSLITLRPLLPFVGCPCQMEGGCVCADEERVLRAYAYGLPMVAMTPEQRAACLEEISLVEGYDRKDYEDVSDKDLAAGVLSAWMDYVRDLGLL